MNSTFLFALAIGLIIFGLIMILQKLPAQNLARKFKQLGNMKGMDISDIVAAVGPYKAKRIIDGGYICVWSVPGYTLSLIFSSDNKVLSIDTELAV